MIILGAKVTFIIFKILVNFPMFFQGFQSMISHQLTYKIPPLALMKISLKKNMKKSKFLKENY